ncbi:beta-ketoacyl synthase N-terminal-like domain-containing protein [Henriciella litoralis]|uniref:beta-ketoacyl synthase N-terminal-like domain-containing protein n=1 Tax=Henriciella litoralis TaxID=568102 RepID=UPI001F2D3D35|nr:beta-ketoacyl synthase N-terminal-like domain-containing protein [Henriciella litoralis]
MTAVYVRSLVSRTSLGDSGKQLAERLRTPDPALLGLPPMLAMDCEDQQIRVPVHLASAYDPSSIKARFYTLLESIVERAINEANLSASDLRRTGLFFSSSSSDVCLIEDRFAKDVAVNADAVSLDWRCDIDNVGAHIRSKFGFGPVGMSVNTACASSANATLYARGELLVGEIDHAIVVALETFNATTALGFHSLDLLTDSAMRPFDERRNGLILGEGSAAMVLSRSADSDTSLAVLGGASLTDTHSISASNPDGSSIEVVIRKALANSDVEAGSVWAVKSHGTASLLNDEGESAGLTRVFGERLPMVSALKPYIGHTFGASGLCELSILSSCLAEGFWPGTPGIGADEAELGISLVQQAENAKAGPILLNHFGFGGVNTCLVVSNV